MNTQNEHHDQDQNTDKKPGLFPIIFCFCVSAVCFILQLMSFIGNKIIEAQNGIERRFYINISMYSIGVWIGRNIPMLIGIVFLIVAIKDLKKRKEWDKNNK